MTLRSQMTVWLSAFGIAVFQVVGSFGAADNQPDRRGIDVLAVVLVLLGPAALGLRDRWPLLAVAVAIGATNVYLGSGYPYGPIFVSVVVALFTAVVAGHRRTTWALAGAGYAGFVVAYLVDDRAGDVSAVHLSLVAGWLVVVLAVSEVARIRRDQAAEREQAVQDERQRRLAEQRLGLAQELHDVLAHNISMINVQASVALHLIDDQPDQVRPALTIIKDASRAALHELRTALDLLRHCDEVPLDPAPRLADLDRLVAGVRVGGLEVRLMHDPAPVPLPAATELAAYRIVQEALTNVARHARARTVTVRVGYVDGVTVEVVDDGIGGSAVPGNGISGMVERASALGGSVDAGPRPGGGFRVAAHLPDNPERPS